MTLQEWLDTTEDIDFYIFKDLDMFIYAGCVSCWGGTRYIGYVRIYSEYEEIILAVCENDIYYKNAKEAKIMALKKYKQLLLNQLDVLKEIEL